MNKSPPPSASAQAYSYWLPAALSTTVVLLVTGVVLRSLRQLHYPLHGQVTVGHLWAGAFAVTVGADGLLLLSAACKTCAKKCAHQPHKKIPQAAIKRLEVQHTERQRMPIVEIEEAPPVRPKTATPPPQVREERRPIQLDPPGIGLRSVLAGNDNQGVDQGFLNRELQKMFRPKGPYLLKEGETFEFVLVGEEGSTPVAHLYALFVLLQDVGIMGADQIFDYTKDWNSAKLSASNLSDLRTFIETREDAHLLLNDRIKQLGINETTVTSPHLLPSTRLIQGRNLTSGSHAFIGQKGLSIAMSSDLLVVTQNQALYGLLCKCAHEKNIQNRAGGTPHLRKEVDGEYSFSLSFTDVDHVVALLDPLIEIFKRQKTLPITYSTAQLLRNATENNVLSMIAEVELVTLYQDFGVRTCPETLKPLEGRVKRSKDDQKLQEYLEALWLQLIDHYVDVMDQKNLPPLALGIDYENAQTVSDRMICRRRVLLYQFYALNASDDEKEHLQLWGALNRACDDSLALHPQKASPADEGVRLNPAFVKAAIAYVMTNYKPSEIYKEIKVVRKGTLEHDRSVRVSNLRDLTEKRVFRVRSAQEQAQVQLPYNAFYQEPAYSRWKEAISQEKKNEATYTVAMIKLVESFEGTKLLSDYLNQFKEEGFYLSLYGDDEKRAFERYDRYFERMELIKGKQETLNTLIIDCHKLALAIKHPSEDRKVDELIEKNKKIEEDSRQLIKELSDFMEEVNQKAVDRKSQKYKWHYDCSYFQDQNRAIEASKGEDLWNKAINDGMIDPIPYLEFFKREWHRKFARREAQKAAAAQS